MFRRMKAGWNLTKRSWGVVRGNPSLLRLPIVGGILGFLVMVALGAPGALLAGTGESAEQVGGFILIALGIYLGSAVMVFYNVALAAAADQALRGNDVDLGVARAVARGRMSVVLTWTAISVAISALLSFIRDKGGLAGNLLAAIGGAIWSLVTFLVIPVVALEQCGPITAMKRSASLFKQRWGEQVTGNIAIGGIAGLVMFVAILVGVGGFFALVSGEIALQALGVVLLAIAAAAGVATAVFSGATRGVFGVVLYHYMADDEIVGPFEADDLEHAVTTK